MILRFITIFLFLIYAFAFPSNETDQQALLSFKASITDDPFGVLSSWNTSIHFCKWNGVTCSHRRQRVRELNLTLQHLGGRLSSHIGNLSFLRLISLRNNNFHGSIPNEIGRLFRLQYLFFGNNSFQGVFPNLSRCADMRFISLYNNNLEGKLPTEFTSLSKLKAFDLGNNQFHGPISPLIGNVSSSLRFLHLGRNNLAGEIPLEVGHLAKLEFLYLSSNNFSGMVPLPLYNISSLYSVSLTQNQLEGTLPADLGITLPNLQEFDGGINRFSGPLPSSIANVSSLVTFDILGNNIIGPIPNNLGSLPNLGWLNLGQNPLGDSMRPNELSFFNSLVNCSNLYYLALNENGLRGKLPNSIVNLSTTLEQLYLYGNHIYGSIPREIGKLVNLIMLSLDHNFLRGTIPESIGELSKLGRLDLRNNNISGVIPAFISNITQLLGLYISNNMIQGSMPTALFNISTLHTLSLANNRLEGIIPEQIVFSSQCVILLLAENLFTGPLPSNIGNLKQLVILDVADNELTGNIPATLGGCVMLEELYMDGNLFQGGIPSSFKTLRSLKFLDLSSNNISKNIPGFFSGFHLIKFVNFSHNKLGGEVPRDGIFSNISAFSIFGNLELCGGIPALHLPACAIKVSRKRTKTITLRIIILLVFVPLGILLACLALICYRRRNSKKLHDTVPILKDNKYLKLSYHDLLQATNEFSPDNLLGEGRHGSVYKGVLESVEHMVVAVKVLNVEVRGATKSFLAECETLRNLRHRNLIKIITACSSIDFKGNDFKALVFEFMINGSVDNWLHPSPHHQRNERNLTLLQRLNISIDVALGVDYLHHHNQANIIHCDIKPSNILLDEDFVAHIGDFGLARFCFAATSGYINQAQLGSTGVRGTVGYVPPEYGMGGEISTEGDVYSYGIFLLEMFSGKRPTENGILIEGDSNLHGYVRKALPQRVMDIADPRIVLDQEKDCMTVNQSYSRATVEVCLASIFEVGLLCSDEAPKKRIDISVAIKQLIVAKDKLLQRNNL